MFKSLSDKLLNTLGKLKSKAVLSEDDINMAMREVKLALLEADVALPVVKDFITKVKEQAIGQEIVKKINPAQMVIKIVQDTLEEVLGSETNELNLKTKPPTVILFAGLQGSGKTTSCAKIANFIKNKKNKKILMASLDAYRPAAKEQLKKLGEQIQIDTVEIVDNEKPATTAKRALKKAKLEAYDILMLDSAGRLHIDNEMMSEIKEINKITDPNEVLLVGDSLTGQDAVNVAKNFKEALPLTGLVLTRVDGDSRGGAALSMKFITDCPIKFIGTGEKIKDLDVFHPERIASRILEMGDVVSLVEKAQEVVDEEETKKLEKKMRKGTFDLNDLASQLKNLSRMGGLGSIASMLPGMGKIKEAIADRKMDDNVIKHQLAIISSMTKQERQFPKLINSSRKQRIVVGSGRTVQEINKLLKQFFQMQKMMKKIGKMDKKSLMRGGMEGLLG